MCCCCTGARVRLRREGKKKSEQAELIGQGGAVQADNDKRWWMRCTVVCMHNSLGVIFAGLAVAKTGSLHVSRTHARRMHICHIREVRNNER